MYSSGSPYYTIPAVGNINRDFYILATGSTAFTITLPAISIHQAIHIRNQNSVGIKITAALNTTSIYPNQTGGGVVTPTYLMPSNTVQNFYCDGPGLQGF